MPFKRKDTGAWYCDIRPRVGGKPTGERIRLLMPHVRTKPEAKEEEHRIALELREGKPACGANFEAFVRAHYLPWADQNKIASANDHSRAQALISFFGDKQLSEVSIFNIEQYKRERAKTKTIRGDFYAPGTINNELSTLSRIMNMALAGGLVKKNPMADVSPLEQSSWRTRSLAAEEEKRLFKHLDRPEYLRPIVKFALLTGMRQGEILDLQWEHVRLDRSLVYVAHTKWKDDPRKTKGLPVVEEACQLLASLKRTSVYVFPNTVGSMVFANNLRKVFDRAKDEAGIDDFRFHDLRHTFGTRMAESGVKLHKLQRLMGHQDPKMTMRYVHVDEEELRDALRTASPFLEGKSLAVDPGQVRKVG